MPAPTPAQIEQLTAQGCKADDWSTISFAADTDPGRIRNAYFRGAVSIGPNGGSATVDGVRLPCGIYDATLVDCTVGVNVRIARIGSVVANVDIGDGAVVEDVAALTVDPGATFGAGTEVETVNEGGGRIVVLFPGVTAQTAWLQAFRVHSDVLQAALAKLFDAEVQATRSDRGVVGERACVVHSGTIRNVAIGANAVIDGAASLENGTILSCAEHPTTVSGGVLATDFVIAEGASVNGGAILDRTFVGQASRVGKQFSAENALFFANSEAFHGEALAIFAGPYTVTHHKSSLLVAAAYSFYNAGSGTNHSNHMYKLGPVHQGVFERGSKTGSFSYVLHETHVGPFSVVIGKHYTNINTPDLPFAYIHESEGQSQIVPGRNLFSVGTARDGQKWPNRDRRTAPVKRDLITFDVFSPFTVEKMRTGRRLLENLREETPKTKKFVHVGGVQIKRLLFKTCARYYQQGVARYLVGALLDRVEAAGADASWSDMQESLRSAGTLRDPLSWIDVGGLLMPVERLAALEEDVVSGRIDSFAALVGRFRAIDAAYASDAWEYVCAAFTEEHGHAPHEMTAEQAVGVVDIWASAAGSLHAKLLDDSKKEFDAFARISYGLGMSEEDRAAEFEAVRGTADTNSVVLKLLAEQQAIVERAKRLRERLGQL